MASIALEEYELLGDARYRSYVSAVDKALKSFEYTSEWADLISALGKLNKVLLNYMKYPVIPRRITISKRLAQCMHPALPSGVHLKALETYDIIFKCIGSSRLGQELFIYSAGLFPLLGHAAMNVKPTLLMVYENHFVPLGEKLRPGLNGFLIGVLPGLEEGSDYYERTDALLRKVCDGVEKRYFYGCLWKCILANTSIRLPAITYIISHFNKKVTMEDQLYIIGTDIDTMVQAMCSSLQDSSVLVQRCALDLLSLGFPVHNSQLVSADMIHIVTAAITVVLRRDMSLNRRLFSWLLGTDSLSAAEQLLAHRSESISISDTGNVNSYFNTYSKDLLLQALRTCFDSPVSVMSLSSMPSGAPELWSYRLLISLLDRPEISTVILDEILIEVFRSLYLECASLCQSDENFKIKNDKKENKNNKSSSELIKTANLLFGTLEPYFLWEYTAKLFHSACVKSEKQHNDLLNCGQERKDGIKDQTVQHTGAGTPSVLELCILIDFLLDVVSLETYLEARTEHLPSLMCNIGIVLTDYCNVLTPSELSLSLKLCSKILSKVQPAVVTVSPACVEGLSTKFLTSVQNLNVVDDFLRTQERADQKNLCCDDSKDREFQRTISESSEFELLSSQEVHNLYEESQRSSIHSSSQMLTSTIMNCVESFQCFFVKFVKLRLLLDDANALQCFKNLLVPRKENELQREQKLEFLLFQCLDSSERLLESDICRTDLKNEQELPEKLLNTIHLDVLSNVHLVSEAFNHVCHLLVELSSFPTYCTSSKRIFDAGLKNGDCTSLPEWLQLLLTLACFINIEDFHFTAMSTLLDLIALTKSVTVNPELQIPSSSVPPSPIPQTSFSSSVVSVVIIPMISVAELVYLWKETRFFPLAAAKLWRYLNDSTSCRHLQTVELLQQVHNLALDSTVCEGVISRSLASDYETEQVEALKKFCILWHLTRDLRLKSTPSNMLRAFDRCLFLMLDNLGKETGSQKAVAQGWLNHSLQRGDIARILEPILLILLHPDSARVSVQHVNVHCPKKTKGGDPGDQDDNGIEAKIYAISSVSGNVIYHVSDDSHPSSNQGSPEKKILALTSIINMGSSSKSSKVVTSNSMIQDFELPSSYERDFQLPISLFINPFGSLSSFGSDPHLESSSPPDLSTAKRINTLLRKSSFDDNDTEPDMTGEGKMTSEEIVHSILDEIITTVVLGGKNDLLSDKDGFVSSSDYMEDVFHQFDHPHLSGRDTNNYKEMSNVDDHDIPQLQELTVHPLHTYLLLYCQVYDSQKTLYVLYTLKAIILTNPRVTLCNMATTSISSSLSPRGQQLQVLLARHRKSVFGNNFHGEMNAEATTSYRSSTFVEVIVSACLYYIRSYYPNLPQVRLTDEEVVGNRNVRLLCTEVLTLIFSELVGIVKDSGKSFASYLSDLLQRCKVQKTLLHCMVASVYDSRFKKSLEGDSEVTFTETIIEFNEKPYRVNQYKEQSNNDFQDTFQVHILRLMATLIVLEDTIVAQNNAEKDSRSGSGPKLSDTNADRTSRIKFQAHVVSSKYQPGIAIPSQPMFLTAIISALRQKHKTHLHTYWLSLVTSAIPFAGRSLTRMVVSVVSQLCHNLEDIASDYSQPSVSATSKDSCNHQSFQTPPDYLLTLVEGLTTLCHYCLLDCPAPVSTIINQPPLPPVPSQPYAPGANASQIISNLIHVFSTSSTQKNALPGHDQGCSLDLVLSARRTLLSNMPRILASLTSLWQITTTMDKVDKGAEQPQVWWIMGTPKVVNQHILSFLSPISLNYGSHFIAAVAVVWYDCRAKGTLSERKVIPLWSKEQLLLVQLVAAIKVMPMETVVQTVRQVLRQPPPTSHDKSNKRVPLEVNILQFFLAYVQYSRVSQLGESWQSLLSLWKEGLQLTAYPPVQFHLLAILHEFVLRAPFLEDKKAQKDLQDVTQKLVETCSTVAGACLEQTTWLWRNYAVRPGPQQDVPESDVDSEDKLNMKIRSAKDDTISSTNSSASSNGQFSVQALCVLAEFLAPVLDVVYVSEEKEKVVPLLSNIMHCVTPYLRNHRPHNIPSFRACSQLLASMSGYQYTRKAWRKDAFDLLLDPSFFQMDSSCIGHWRSIIDHLMTHDKTTFRDFMARVAIAQTGSLNLFSSKEQEYEQKAHLLKRLAFVLFCSEVDQYHRFMPDIQERLAENLRLPQVPSVQAQVFLCFRVLLLRMSPHHVTSLWPVIITEMVQVFLQIEHELCTDSEEFRKIPSMHLRRLSTLDSTWVVNTSNGLNAHNNPAWLQLYLSACKLLDMAVALPADTLPQFQMYRWAFVGDSPPLSSENNHDNETNLMASSPEFVPHIMRLAALLNRKVLCEEKLAFIPGQPLLSLSTIKSLTQLQPFFNALSNISHAQLQHNSGAKIVHSKDSKVSSLVYSPSALSKSRSAPELHTLCHTSNDFDTIAWKTTSQKIEHILELDFLEPCICT